MPIYNYRRLRCGLKFERKQSFNDTSEVRCPKCQGEVQRIIFPTPIIFKEGGFSTTYRG